MTTKCAEKLFQLFIIVIFSFFCTANATAQTFTSLLSFEGQPDGRQPSGVLVQGTDGNFYGTTSGGGAYNSCTYGCGSIFKITPGGTLTTIYSFCSESGICPDGYGPGSGLVLGTDGNFYGTTPYGGLPADNSVGTVFKITKTGAFTTLYTFCQTDYPTCPDGAYPFAGLLVLATDGNFYGTTSYGGAYGDGTVFKITTQGTLTTLYSFCAQANCADGSGPSGLIQATDGNFYGVTGGGAHSDGTVFKITPAGTLTTLYSFCAQANCADGSGPSGLIQATDGNFYGTTGAGGTSGDCSGGCGTAFKITPTGKLTTLHSFDSAEGSGPFGLVQATDGNFYGTTSGGGASGSGAVFKITPAGEPTTLHSFDYLEIGHSTLVQGSDGSLYGETAWGGDIAGLGCQTMLNTLGGCGTIFSDSVGLAPFVTFIRNSGIVGAKAQILGQGFEDATAVSFNGTAASFKVVSDTFMTATVPAGATTGDLTVTEHTGTLTSNKVFRVQPTTQCFTPSSGPAGTVVTIHGMSLAQTTAVSFHGVPATSFSVISNTEVQATVPAGATTGHIEIWTAGGSFITKTFTVTP